MSLAQQPDPRPARGGVHAAYWAVAAAGLALLIVILTVSVSLPPALQPIAPSKIVVHPPRAATGGASSTVLATEHPHVGAQSAHVAHSTTRQASKRPIVEIVERRLPIRRSAAEDASTAAVRPAAAAPRLRVAWDRDSPKAPTEGPPIALAPAPVETLPGGGAEQGKEQDTPPEPFVRTEARYPEDAAAEDVTGSVRLKVVVGQRGRVEDAFVVHSSGDDRLDQAAETAIRQWRYHPAYRNGHPVTAVDYVVIDFYRDDNQKRQE